ncbi:bifunctional metallophosphatase/5'-nucleotidase [Bacillus lacus]|uniref:Bifunctional metallophosphatase/5'-nucleotidase n=1 Tax=Metabacillus lacus TaxID=1983721 RepID=A0A7X2LZZ0_9BACI|nr:5'-nucleotidase C-terminal domain-containing protein [Metabacillus lacus]MRX73971.1 bifunctional metallophosphatase/5'-nucleotidase [Metabacillus lacus]
MKSYKQVCAAVLAVLIGLAGILHPGAAEASKNPQAPADKGTFIKELVTSLGIDLQGSDIPYSDVDSELAPYIQAAIRTNILPEDGKTKFGPNEKITKEQAYVFLIRSLNLRDSYSLGALKKFKDYNAIHSAYHRELAAAAELDLIDRKLPVFQPKKPLTGNDIKNMLESLQKKLEFVTVIHTNDMHGRIMHNPVNKEMGLAKISSIANSARSKNPTILIDMGDTFHGTNYVNLNKGMAAAEAMNAMKYDAMVPGNHDFNYGQAHLLNLKKMLQFPLISANIKTYGSPFLEGFTIVERKGKKIALIGLTATDTAVKTNPSGITGITFEDETETAKKLALKLKGKVDAVAVISHSGLDTEMKIANEVSGIDVVFGGHSHDTIETPKKLKHAYVTQANEYGKALGHTNLIFHKGKLIGVNGFLYRDSESKKEDSKVRNVLQPYKEQVDRELNVVIASVSETLNGERNAVRTKETNLGNYIADAMKNKLKTDIAVTNGGGIRASIVAGDVTRNHVLTTLPFDNTLVRTTLKGSDLKAALEHSVRLYPAENGGFLHVSGLAFNFDPSKPTGSRVTEVVINGAALDLQKSYSVATNNFTAAGGDGFVMFTAENIEFDSGELLSTVLMEALQSNTPVPGIEGRIKITQ